MDERQTNGRIEMTTPVAAFLCQAVDMDIGWNRTLDALQQYINDLAAIR